MYTICRQIIHMSDFKGIATFFICCHPDRLYIGQCKYGLVQEILVLMAYEHETPLNPHTDVSS